MIEVAGDAVEPFTLAVADLPTMPRRQLDADFHCVAGWSTEGLHWEGVAFETLYSTVIGPALGPDAVVTHVVLEGLDGYRAVVTIGDALGADVLIADRLNGRPLDPDHGAPVRFVSAGQYGHMSTKHLCRIELHTHDPGEDFSRLPRLAQVFLRGPFAPHPRARVWEEERNRYLPPWVVRPVYRMVIAPIRAVCRLGSGPPT